MTDTIIFEGYSGPVTTDGTVVAHYSLATLASEAVGGIGRASYGLISAGVGDTPSADAIGQAVLPFTTLGSDATGGVGMASYPLDTTATGLTPSPDVSIGVANLPPFVVHGTGYTTQDAQVAARFALTTLASSASAIGRARLDFKSYASDGLSADLKTGFLLQQPIIAAHAYQGLIGMASDTVVLGDSAARQVAFVLQTLVRLSDTLTPYTELLRTIHTTIGLADFVQALFRATAADRVVFSDVAGLSELHLFALIDHVTLLTGASSTQETTRAVAVVLALSERLDTPILQALLSGVGFSDELVHTIEAYAAALDAIRFTDGLGANLLLQLALADGVVFNDHADLLTEITRALKDALAVAASLSIDGESYTAWVMGMDSKAVWTYDNYPFNSFASFAGKRYAAGPDGISELGGSDDNGTDIAWEVRTGMTNLGTMLEKRLDTGYLGYTSRGTVGMSVIVRDAGTGERVQYNYELDPIPSDEVVTNRIKLGRGLESVYFAFRYAGTGPFSLDNARILKLNLRRRV